MKILPLWMVVLSLVWALSGCFEKDSKQILVTGNTMGTSYSVTIVAPPSGLQQAQLQAQFDAELASISRLISTWDSESELSVFNATETTEWVPMSAPVLDIIKAAKRVSKETDGAYDVTLGSISSLWGFGPQADKNASGDAVAATNRQAGDSPAQENPVSKPSFNDILLLMNDVGYQLLLVSGREAALRKLTPGLQVDLSSIGKGYAVDRIGAILESLAVTRYLVEIGGEIRTRGLAADGGMWKIGIETPVSLQQNIKKGLAVENAHIASSGDYRNYRELDGERLSHLLDGRSGFPVSHKLAAVTLLHGSVMMADAWATAFMVLGYDEAVKIAEAKGLAVQFTLREGAGFSVRTTSAFEAFSYTEK